MGQIAKVIGARDDIYLPMFQRSVFFEYRVVRKEVRDEKSFPIIRFIVSRSLLSEFILFLQLTCLAVFAIGTIQPIERYIRQ